MKTRKYYSRQLVERGYESRFRLWYTSLLIDLFKKKGYALIKRETLLKLVTWPKPTQVEDEAIIEMKKILFEILKKEGQSLEEKIICEKSKVYNEITNQVKRELYEQIKQEILHETRIRLFLEQKLKKNVNFALPEPTSEPGTIAVLGRYCDCFGYKIKSIGHRFPDCILEKDGKEIRAEIEFKLSSFHHDPSKCDLIICWINDIDNGNEFSVRALKLKKAHVPILELRKALPFRFKSQFRHSGIR